MYCKKCKKSYEGDALFCEECGERLIPEPDEKTEKSEETKPLPQTEKIQTEKGKSSTGKSIAVKVAIGVAAVAVVGAGAFFGYRILKNRNAAQQIVAEKDNKEEDSKKSVSIKELNETIDYRYLKSLAMLLPCYEEVSDLTESDIVNLVSTSLLYKNMQLEGMIPKNTDLYPILIDDKDVLQFDTEEPLLPIEEQFESTYYENISVKNTALDQAFAIMGYPGNWVDAYKDALLTEAHLNEESLKETINFKEDSIDVYTGGRGGFSNTMVQIKDTKLGKKEIQVVYQYQVVVGEETVTDEERIMTVIPAENAYGYKIQSVAKSEKSETQSQEESPAKDKEKPATDKNSSTEEKSSENLFAKMPSEFVFSSGVGAWGTVLTLHEDGTFEGSYHDSDMGDMEYANGTIYVCEFKGKFSQPEKIGDWTYKMNLESIEYAKEPGQEEVINDTHYVYTDAHGLEQATDGFIVYEPGIAADSLPEDCRSWNFEITFNQETTLGSWGIYNPGAGTAFFGK